MESAQTHRSRARRTGPRRDTIFLVVAFFWVAPPPPPPPGTHNTFPANPGLVWPRELPAVLHRSWAEGTFNVAFFWGCVFAFFFLGGPFPFSGA